MSQKKRFFYSESFEQQRQVIENIYANRRPLLLYGPTGCGKTTLVHQLASEVNSKLVEFIGFEHATEQDLIGHYTIVGGDTVFVDGPLLKAVKEGATFYLDELNFLNASVLALLHPLLDERRTVYHYAKGKMVKAHPEFRFVGSFNKTVLSVSDAFRQRCTGVAVNYLPADEESNLLSTRTGLDKSTASFLAKAANAIRAQSEVIVDELSTRTLINAANIIVDMDCRFSEEEMLRILVLDSLTDDQSVKDVLVSILKDKAILGETIDTSNIDSFGLQRAE